MNSHVGKFHKSEWIQLTDLKKSNIFFKAQVSETTVRWQKEMQKRGDKKRYAKEMPKRCQREMPKRDAKEMPKRCQRDAKEMPKRYQRDGEKIRFCTKK